VSSSAAFINSQPVRLDRGNSTWRAQRQDAANTSRAISAQSQPIRNRREPGGALRLARMKKRFESAEIYRYDALDRRRASQVESKAAEIERYRRHRPAPAPVQKNVRSRAVPLPLGTPRKLRGLHALSKLPRSDQRIQKLHRQRLIWLAVVPKSRCPLMDADYGRSYCAVD
jgi:hypothetical protein